ncbi:hypothetical protein SMF913_27024 [Streptomyces malaysiensis]|uniref:Uncharacterized protein n=1 Tax=Streptomyces malaysiensis TaxID=92644 RepID=A0A2J7YUJ2_STRMQ|nr:hypothetical protein SMF913_27024 [Streptomyces malaysiensis]
MSSAPARPTADAPAGITPTAGDAASSAAGTASGGTGMRRRRPLVSGPSSPVVSGPLSFSSRGLRPLR